MIQPPYPFFIRRKGISGFFLAKFIDPVTTIQFRLRKILLKAERAENISENRSLILQVSHLFFIFTRHGKPSRRQRKPRIAFHHYRKYFLIHLHPARTYILFHNRSSRTFFFVHLIFLSQKICELLNLFRQIVIFLP